MKGRSEPSDVLVVGGGIVGVACAEACASAGLDVRLIEQDRVGSGATGAGMGHVVLMAGELLPLTRYSQKLWRTRASDWVGQVAIRPTGTIWLARGERERGQLDTLESALRLAKVSLQRLENEELHRQETALAPAVTDGLWVKEDLLVDPVSAAQRLAALAQGRKVEIMEGMRVEALVDGGVRLAEGTTLRARHVVVATGVETARLLPELGIHPRKGHIVQLAAAAGYLRAQLGEVGYALGAGFGEAESVAFNVYPSSAGGLWLGASRQNGVDTPEVDEHIVERLLSRAREFLGDFDDLPIVHRWTGLRPASPDHRPFIGPWPGRSDLLVAAGHEGLGVTTSLATGRIIADIVTGRRSEVDRSPFDPAGRLRSDPTPRKGGRRSAK